MAQHASPPTHYDCSSECNSAPGCSSLPATQHGVDPACYGTALPGGRPRPASAEPQSRYRSEARAMIAIN